MSHLEYIELINTFSVTIAGHTMNFFAILAAYLVTAFFVGPRLGRFQVWSLTALYSLFCFFPISTVVSDIYRAGRLADELVHKYPDAAGYYPVEIDVAVLQVSLTVIFIAAWVLSIAFMYNVRRNSDATST